MGEPNWVFIIPVLNESSIIGRSLHILDSAIRQGKSKFGECTIVVADNGSSDDTGARVTAVMAELQTPVVYQHIPDRGRGIAIRLVLERVRARNYCYLDADLPLELTALPGLLEPIQEGRADITVLSRRGQRPFFRRILTGLMKKINSTLLHLDFDDCQSGVKAFSSRAAELMKQCREPGYFLDTEFLSLAQSQNLRIHQEPTPWIERRYPERQSKVRPVKDSLQALSAQKRIFCRQYPQAVGAIKHLFGLVALLAVSYTVFTLFWLTFPAPVHRLETISILFCVFHWLAYLVLVHGLIRSTAIPARLLTTIIMLLAAAVYLVLALQPPSLSQDLYWNLLLGKGSAIYHLSPYVTTPNDLTFDSWSANVTTWRDLSMTHGPLWAAFLHLVVSLVPTSQIQAIILVKLLFGGLLLFCLHLWRSLMKNHLSEKALPLLLGLLAFNPLVLQHIPVDGHNDILVMLGILISYYFLQQKKYALCLISLILAGGVKYAPWLLLPIPIVELWRSPGTWKAKSRTLFLTVLGSVLLLAAMYWPYGISALQPPGLVEELTKRLDLLATLPGALILLALFRLTVAQLHLVGLLLFTGALGYFIYRRKTILAYTVPFLVLFFWGTSWFMPWYILWVYLFLPFLVSLPGFLVLTLLIYFSSVGFHGLFLLTLLLFLSTVWVLLSTAWGKKKSICCAPDG
ncbi:hypothetical protein AUK40_02840 [Candidatus Wirthbacteria bacterium CG2_30_54_11]|uniref:Glycosyltransferase 2-like domain-containing protein n=1 Tax=Candidatus Wirthbacteria bacterium CG2_30_54_11 TaxID=1817892 RepID=A0A1J5IZ38_9BACT|nr:MAG: hypothetical protein AUK40_02840 [Candidatus Wirthbacteria bacterium CG2_30_54_11]